MADLKPFAIQFAGMHQAIHALSDADLLKLRDACKRVSSAHDWWAEYAAGTYLLEKVEGVVESRRRKANATSVALAQPQGDS